MTTTTRRMIRERAERWLCRLLADAPAWLPTRTLRARWIEYRMQRVEEATP